MDRKQVRFLEIEAKEADAGTRRVPAVLSTTHPVDRSGYLEVLLHGRENVDLSRDPLPLLESHDGMRLPIGRVENLRLDGTKLRADLVMGRSARAADLWPDIEAGIVRNLSIGYVIQDYRTRGDTIEVTRWQPFEASFVSIPADPNAGTYRRDPMFDHEDPQPAAHAGDRPSRSQRRAAASRSIEDLAADAEQARVEEILGIAQAYRKHNLGDLAVRACNERWPVDRFKAEALQRMGEPPRAMADPADLRQHQHERGSTFSLIRAIGGIIDPRNVDAGYEREVSQEIARRTGRKPEGFYMPIGSLASRVLSVSGAGGLVPTQHMDAEFIDVLRRRSVVMTLGARVLDGLVGDVSIPRLATSATAGWIGGDGSDGLTPSDATFDAVTLSPKTVGALTPISRKLVLQGVPGAEQIVRNDFAALIATELDRAAIEGSGQSNQPTGILATLGISEDTYAGAIPTWAEIVAMEGDLAADNADLGSIAYLANSATAADLKATEKATGTAQFIWTAGRERGSGEMNGLPAYASNNVPLETVILGNWADLLMGLWGAVDVAVDPHYDFAKGTIAVRVMASVDFAVRHAPSFVVYTRGGAS